MDQVRVFGLHLGSVGGPVVVNHVHDLNRGFRFCNVLTVDYLVIVCFGMLLVLSGVFTYFTEAGRSFVSEPGKV